MTDTLRRWRREGVLVPVVVLVVGVLASAAWLTFCARGLYFYSDDWDFVLSRGTIPHTSTNLFAPHNGHWSTSIVLINLTLFAAFGLHTYLPWALTSVALHLLTCLAAYAVLRRAGTAAWPAVLAVLLVLASGSSGSLVQASAMNLVASLLCGLMAVHSLLRRPEGAGVRLAWVWLLVGLTCSALGVTMVVLAALVAWWTRGLRAAAALVVVPALAWGAWFLGWGREDVGDYGFSGHGVRAVSDYVWSGLSRPFSFGTTHVGAVVAALLLVLAVVAAVLGRGGTRELRGVALAGSVTAAAQLLLTALTPRLDFGNPSAGEGRYGYVTLVLLLPTVALAFTIVASWVRGRRFPVRGLAALAAIALVVAWALPGVEEARDTSDALRLLTSPGRDRVVALAAAARIGERVLTPVPQDPFDGYFRADLVTDPGIASDLPTGPVDPQRRLDVEAQYLTTVSTADPHLLYRADVTGTGFSRPITKGQGCGTYRATGPHASVSVPSLYGAEIGFAGPAGSVSTQISRDGLASTRTWKTVPGRPYFVGTTAQVATMTVTFDRPGRYRICTG